MEDLSEVIDVDSYDSNKGIGKMKQKAEVIDLDLSPYIMPDVIDVDSYENIVADKVKIKRNIVDGDSSSNPLLFDDAALAIGQASVKADCEDVTKVFKKPKKVQEPQRAPVSPDQWVPETVKKSHHVIQRGDAVYDAMLTQTNIANDTNDFFVIQVLKANTTSSYMVYNRWGRVGEQGEVKLFGPHSSCSIAVREFEDIFYMKTKNHWSERNKFVSYPKCYTWLEMNYRKKEQDKIALPRVGKSTYGPRVEKFMSLICNFSMMTQQMTDIGYDAEKLPLANLSKSTIMKAYDVLTLIAEVIGESNRTLLEELSQAFYEIIPHVFVDKRMRNFIIDNHHKLRSKLEMVESLGEIENATKLLGHCAGQQIDVMFAQYQLLRCTLAPVEASTKEFEMIENYMKNTAASNSRPEIVEIFRVSKEGENERFEKYARIKNRMLLWHGSRLTNLLGILSQGLRIAPKEVPLSGATFGRGLYFADMFAKSEMYCRSNTVIPDTALNTHRRIGILLLCEVALGEMSEVTGGKSNANLLPPGKLSVKGVGRMAPNEYKVLEDGVIIPTGKAVTGTTGGLWHNEYIVYNEDQVKMRYIVQVKY